MYRNRLPLTFLLHPQNISNLNFTSIQFPTQPIYKCTLCPKKFGRKSSLSRHFRKHTGEKYFSCEVCCKSFSRRDILKQHKQSRKCVIKSMQFNNHKRGLSSMSSPVSSSSTSDVRMSISWLLTDSSDSPCLSSGMDSYQTSSPPYYYY